MSYSSPDDKNRILLRSRSWQYPTYADMYAISSISKPRGLNGGEANSLTPFTEDPKADLLFSTDTNVVDTRYMKSRPEAVLEGSPSKSALTTILAVCAGICLLMRKFNLLKRKRAVTPQSALVVREMIPIPIGGTATDGFDVQAAEIKYSRDRAELVTADLDRGWDYPARSTASPAELRAQTIVWTIREAERVGELFGNIASEAIPLETTRDMGGQYLTNKDRIMKSRIFDIAKRMPKGMHLHLHFNAELQPDELIKRAITMECMFIRSTQPILTEKDYAETEMVFNILPLNTPTVNIFSTNYKPEFRAPGATPWMRWSTFRNEYQKLRQGTAEEWIKEKLILSEEEAYNVRQTTNGVWARFNQATRCFKGLFNYESIYRWYIGAAIDDMIQDGVMYAELRPMLMDKFIPSDDGENKVDHNGQMRIMVEEVAKKQAQLRKEGRGDKFPFGLKIIYCAPRSIPKWMMQREIQDCIKLKREFPDLICGFDLVGAEDRPNHIGFYKDELIAMVDQCNREKISIPFMFHAGETLLDTGGSTDPSNSNLYDAVLLNAKRIGHGFSLLKHPVLVKHFRERPICIELCPTSNELLHLCRNIKEHPYPEILAAGIPCTVNSDNPSLFSNTVSTEFYQIMVGSPTMTIHGWRQLAEWSIQFSCLTDAEKNQARGIFRREWEEFCAWIDWTHGTHADSLTKRVE